MLLLELRELLDRTEYGYWIDPTNQPHPVETEGHYDWVEDNIPGAEASRDQGIDPYFFAFDQGYVRVMHPHEEGVNIEGTREAITRAARLIIPTIAQQDVEELMVDVIKQAGDPKDGRFVSNHYAFYFPKERRDAIAFLKGQ